MKPLFVHLIFDINHALEEATVASCVVFSEEGPTYKEEITRYGSTFMA